MVCVRGGVGGIGGEWVTGLGLAFINSGGTWGNVGYVSCVLVAVVWVVLGKCGWAARVWEVGVVLCLSVL